MANAWSVQNQDHYAVLGLSKYRWRATDEQIKKAHRKKVLKHHPDKKASAGQNDDDSFFKCIQKGIVLIPAFLVSITNCYISYGDFDRLRQAPPIRLCR